MKNGATDATAADVGVGLVPAATVIVAVMLEHRLQLVLAHTWPDVLHDGAVSLGRHLRGVPHHGYLLRGLGDTSAQDTRTQDALPLQN